jgi:hypothetical protein
MTQLPLFAADPCLTCRKAPRHGRWLDCAACLDAQARRLGYADWAIVARATEANAREMDRLDARDRRAA